MGTEQTQHPLRWTRVGGCSLWWLWRLHPSTFNIPFIFFTTWCISLQNTHAAYSALLDKAPIHFGCTVQWLSSLYFFLNSVLIIHVFYHCSLRIFKPEDWEKTWLQFKIKKINNESTLVCMQVMRKFRGKNCLSNSFHLIYQTGVIQGRLFVSYHR